MLDTTARRRAARVLCDHRLARRPLDRLPEGCRPVTEAEAYAVQDELHGLLGEAGHGPRVGWKIGCTTPVMQAYLGITTPCAGGMLEANVRRGPARLSHGRYVRPGVECEIAVQLGADLPASGAPYDRMTAGRAVAACWPAIEVVDDRYVRYRDLGTPTLIADDFFHAGAVLGWATPGSGGGDVGTLVGITTIDGAEVGRGRGEAVMGHPFEALAWLANARAARGLGLKAGELVLLGSLVETRWVPAGAEVRVVIEGLGEARASFTA